MASDACFLRVLNVYSIDSCFPNCHNSVEGHAGIYFETMLINKGFFSPLFCCCYRDHDSRVFFFNRNNPLVLGANNSNLPRILQIFGEMFVHDVLSDDEAARNRVLSIMRLIQVRKITDFSSVESKSVEQGHCEKGEGCGVLVLLYEVSN